MKCKDCGAAEYKASKEIELRGRNDVCVDCWQVRGQFVAAASAGKLTHDQFVYGQTGRGKKRVDRMKEVLATIR